MESLLDSMLTLNRLIYIIDLICFFGFGLVTGIFIMAYHILKEKESRL